jgi:hypothetical protein
MVEDLVTVHVKIPSKRRGSDHGPGALRGAEHGCRRSARRRNAQAYG